MASQPAKCSNPECPTPVSESESPSLQRCSRCRTISYCSRDCQVAHWSVHKPACTRPNYIIQFHLHPEHIDNPSVIRTLSCPANATFYQLHQALQAAFGWASSTRNMT
ncbi:hypothetical protein N656DRAFT_701743 [Canariomyces notabilis]|uniref:MYND-type domain-containing protein n=1 Tax=Canariomyces notabilis TaxID=2074819 RepID=A0AAN6TLB2_9PEZI|nr:hypothetical protein N656DRAFT_701743 [Canariomyces arenarius]